MHFIFKISKCYTICQFTQKSGEFFAFQHLAIRHFVCLHPEHTFSVFLIHAKGQIQLFYCINTSYLVDRYIYPAPCWSRQTLEKNVLSWALAGTGSVLFIHQVAV